MTNRIKWTNEKESYLRKIAKNRMTSEIQMLMAEKFDEQFSRSQIESAKKRYKIKSFDNVEYKCVFKKEVRQYIFDHYQEKPYKEMQQELQNIFKKQYTTRQLKSFYYKHNLKNNRNTKMKNGKNNINYKKIGSEKTDFKKRVLVKTDENCWEFKSKVVLRKNDIHLKEDECVIFLDRNNKNFNLDNMFIVNRKILGQLIHCNLTNEKELNKAILQNAKLQQRIKEILKDG